jgi:ATP-dependent RNA helicase DDX10/DBP4
VLNSFSEKLEMSVGLIIGGKDVKYERDRIGKMNILVCTPGRLLQHLEETYGF